MILITVPTLDGGIDVVSPLYFNEIECQFDNLEDAESWLKSKGYEYNMKERAWFLK